MKQPFPYKKTFILGFGFFGISLIWPLFNNFIPIFLQEDFMLSATMTGFIMTWDNYINMFIQPLVGERSDRTRSCLGRRKPWMLSRGAFGSHLLHHRSNHDNGHRHHDSHLTDQPEHGSLSFADSRFVRRSFSRRTTQHCKRYYQLNGRGGCYFSFFGWWGAL